MQVLVLRQNRITAIAGLETLTLLEDLDLYDNLIDEIRGLDQLTALVCVAGCQPAEALGWPRRLMASSLRVSVCVADRALPSDRRLDLSFNRIRTIEHLETLTNLKELYLISNKISVIGGPLPKVAELQRVRRTVVSDLSAPCGRGDGPHGQASKR